MPTDTARPSRWKRRLIVLGSVLVAVLLIVAFLFPYILKRYIETHSEEWIGRKVTIGHIILNPFTFRYGVSDVTCYEPKSDQVFVSWADISVRSNLWAGFRANHWRFTGLRITEPYFHIVQRGDRFNFSDLLELGGEDTTTTADTTAPVRFSMEDIRLTGGRIAYISDVLAAPVGIRDLNATSNIISSESARMDFGLGFELNDGGRMDGGFMLDTEKERYAINAHLRAFALSQLLPYLQDFFRCKALEGSMDIDLDLVDSYADTTSLVLSAAMGLDGVKLLDPDGEQLFGLKNARAALDTVIAKDQHLEVGDVILDGADVRFVLLNDGTDNWTRLLKLDTTATVSDTSATRLQVSESNVFVLLAEYISYLGKQVIASEYTADSLAVVNTTVRFEDHTPALPFNYTITDIRVASQRVTSDQTEGIIAASATLNGTGHLEADAVFDPKDLRNVAVDLTVDKLDLAHLDPYFRWYAAHPVQDGVLRFTTTTSVFEGQLDSQNHLRVDKLKLGKKVDDHDPDIFVLPLRLATGLLKDVHGVVDLDMPVKGDLKDPQFKVWPIVWQVVKNLIVKAATAPGRLLVRAFQGADEEDLERVRFEYMQPGPARAQEKVLKQLASALKAKPELTVELIPIVDAKAEAKEVAVFHAKQAYLFSDKSAIDGADSTRIIELSARDSVFTAYVNGRTAGMEGKSLHDRCLSLLGTAEADRIAGEIEYARRESTMQFLLGQGVEPAHVRYREGTAEELAGQRGVPGFRFVYDVVE